MTLPFGLGVLHVVVPLALLALLVVPLFLVPASPGRRLRIAAQRDLDRVDRARAPPSDALLRLLRL